MKPPTAVLAAALAMAIPGPLARAEPDAQTGHYVVFLTESRPIFVRFRVELEGRPFADSWIDSVRILHASLDKNGDGILNVDEVDAAVLTALVRLATRMA
jgi:hypothetical protein